MQNCLQCQSENSDSATFCISCGASLTHQTNSRVSNGNGVTGTVWWAVVIPAHAPESTGEQPVLETPFPSEQYLDPQQRYRILDAWQDEPGTQTENLWQARVLDTHPLAKTKLESLAERAADKEAALEFVTPYQKLAPLSAAIPTVHDAWEAQGKQVLVLEDRSRWPLLIDRWKQESPPSIQIVWWFAEISKLWQILSQVGCCRSLLAETNLRVDEDYALYLRQLYPDSPVQPPTLADLGQMWQRLYKQLAPYQDRAFWEVLVDLVQGKVATPEQLQSRLQAVAYRLETGSPAHDSPAAVEPEEETTGCFSAGEEVPTMALAAELVDLKAVGLTHVGRRRQHNEDNFYIHTQLACQERPSGKTVQAKGLFIVCDGMGGHAAGEVASAMAVEALQAYFQARWDEPLNEDTISAGVLLANDKIYAANQDQDRAGLGRMGTTLVMALMQDLQVAIAHVGDSRLYRLTRQQGLKQVTIDHEVGQRDVRRGVEPEIAYSRPDAYQLTQALGPRDRDFVYPEIQVLDIEEDTLLLLCSDGLSDQDWIERHTQTHLVPLLDSQANLETGLQALIDQANQESGHDNITAILVRIQVSPCS